MILIEMREQAYNEAFDLLEKAKEHHKKVKEILCELEDCLEDCYKSESDDSYEEGMDRGDENYANIENVEVGEINYRNRRGMRRGMRGASMRDGMHSNMRRSRYSY